MSDFNENIKRLFQSYPEDQYRYETLEFYHPSMPSPYRLYKSAVAINKNFRLESDAPRDAGSSVSFTASDFDISEPGQTAGDNNITSIFMGIGSMDDINKIVDDIEVDSAQFLDPIECIYRIYHNSDVNIAPSSTRSIIYVSSIGMSPSSGVTLTLTSTNNKRYRTGETYSITDFPGLITNG